MHAVSSQVCRSGEKSIEGRYERHFVPQRTDTAGRVAHASGFFAADYDMTYSTLMVHLELGRSNAALLQAAVDFARRFDSKIIGVAGCQPMRMYYAEGYMGDIVEQGQKALEEEISAAEAEFRSTLASKVDQLEWRSTTGYGPVLDFLAHEARAADLVLTGVAHGDAFDSSRAVNTGGLVLQVGRPVLIVPIAARELRLEHVLVGWKDTRESRRTIVDALPLLKQAARVTLGAIAEQEDLGVARTQLADVAHWLARHGVAAEQVASPTVGEESQALWALAQDLGADLLVAGAYGHSRLREWVLGGVTKDLLLSRDRYSLVSH
jgi:nucleotide-binding universal stress UspA family protein